MADTSLEQELTWLYSTQTFGIKLGLEGMTRLLKTCGVYYPKARVIHVAGTNGKGSTCAFAESVARAAGYSTGLFTSPHLVEFGERIRVNGRNIPLKMQRVSLRGCAPPLQIGKLHPPFSKSCWW